MSFVISAGRRRRRSGGGGGGVPADYIITSDAEWASTMALGAATLSGKIAEVRGALTAVTINAIAPAATFTIRGGSGGSVRHIDLLGTTSNITFSGLSFQMTGWPAAYSEICAFGTGIFDNIVFAGNTFRHGYGVGLANFDMTATYPEYTRVDNVQTATTTSTRYALSWLDATATDGFIEFFNPGAVDVYATVGGNTVTTSVGTGTLCPAGVRTRLSPINPTTGTHIAIITATGTSQINARTEIGMSFYLANAFFASGASDMRRIEWRGNTFRDLNNGIKGVGQPTLGIVMDNDFDRIYQDVIVVPPRPGTGQTHIYRNLLGVPFARSGIAENLTGDARDPHGDQYQSQGSGTAAMGPIYVAGNRVRRSARRAGVQNQGVFFSDNNFTPSYNGLFIISDMMIGGAVNGISTGETLYPAGDVLIDGAVVAAASDLVGGTASVRLTTVAENRAHVGRTVTQAILKAGGGFVVDNSLLMSTAASIPALFPNSANIPSAVTRSEIETAWTTAAEATGLGAAATANAIDWGTTDHTAVIQWENVVSGVGWEDLSGQAIGSVITLPLRKVLNRRANQTITPGSGVEWRSTASDGTTEVQAWTTSSGTVQPDQFVQIRATSSAVALTPTNFDVTINGFLARTVVTTTTAAPSVFFTLAGTGPYFLDPAAAVPANTTRMEWRANIYPTSNPGSNTLLFAQASTGCDLRVISGGVLQVTVEDGASTAVVSAQNASSGIILNQWQLLAFDVDHTAGTANLTRDGVNIGSWTWTPTASPFFQTIRAISFFGNSSGANLLPSGWQIEFAECFFTTGGVRSLRKRIAGNAATVNADAWKLPTSGGNAT